MEDLATNNPEVILVKPDVERDSPLAVEWLTGEMGHETLRLMGNTVEHNHPSTLEEERVRTQEHLESKDTLTWMIQLEGKTVGAVWADLEPSEYCQAPSVHIMIGDPSTRGRGVGSATVSAVMDFLTKEGHKEIYSRHLAENKAAKNLLENLGFNKLGDAYSDSDNLVWQNVTYRQRS